MVNNQTVRTISVPNQEATMHILLPPSTRAKTARFSMMNCKSGKTRSPILYVTGMTVRLMAHRWAIRFLFAMDLLSVIYAELKFYYNFCKPTSKSTEKGAQ